MSNVRSAILAGGSGGTLLKVLVVLKIQGLGWWAKTSLTDGISRAEDYVLVIAE